MKRERLTQIVLVIVGLVNLAVIYFLYMDLRHSNWLLEQKNEVEVKSIAQRDHFSILFRSIVDGDPTSQAILDFVAAHTRG